MTAILIIIILAIAAVWYVIDVVIPVDKEQKQELDDTENFYL